MAYVEYTDYPLSQVFEDPEVPGRYIALCDSECTNMIIYDEADEALTVLFEARWREDRNFEYESYTYSPVSYETFEEIVTDENSIGAALNYKIIHTDLSNYATYDRVGYEDYEYYSDMVY